jgi:hypothetical protein
VVRRASHLVRQARQARHAIRPVAVDRPGRHAKGPMARHASRRRR